ncbi:MAG TPA: hypothetical protein VGB91_00830 [Rhizomicrobium sp.]
MADFDFAATLQAGLRVLYATIGFDIVYRPASGDAIECRALFEQPDTGVALMPGANLRDRKQLLKVLQADVPAPAKGDTVEVPKGAPARRVMAFMTPPDDAFRVQWLVELGGP